jgi:hypothetical protein
MLWSTGVTSGNSPVNGTCYDDGSHIVGTLFSVMSQLNLLNVSKHFYTQICFVGWQQDLSFAQQNVPRNMQKFGIPALYNSSIFIRRK